MTATFLGRRHVAAACLVLALTSLFGGCADDTESSAAGVQVPELIRVGAAMVAPRDKLVWSELPAREHEAWVLDAPAFGLEAMPGGEAAAARSMVGATGTARPFRFRRDGSFDPRAFNTVRLTCALSGKGALAVEFWRGGEVVGRVERELHIYDRATTLSFSMPDLGLEPCDRLDIECTGGARRVWLREVELLHVPIEGRVPGRAERAALHVVGGDARLAEGLTPNRSLDAEVDVPTGGQLVFTWTSILPAPEKGVLQLQLLRVDGQAVERRSEETGDGATPDQRAPAPGDRASGQILDTWPLARGGGAWQRALIDLQPWSGRRVRLGFRVFGKRGAAAALADVHVLPAAPAEAPTVVLITSDTHRGDHLGFLGEVDVHTPVLDLVAQVGTAFDDAWAPVNNTTPSHVALFTGTHPRDTGVLDNFSALGEAAPTLAEAFADAGWLTWAAVSNRHLGPVDSGLGQGFARVSWPADVSQRSAAETLERAFRWLPEADGRPLFLWVHVFDPHIPYEPAAADLARHWDPQRDPRDVTLPDPGVPDVALPPTLRGVRDLEYPRAAYRAEVERQDLLLGQLLGIPRVQRGHVAFVADHGEAFGEQGIWFRHEGVIPAVLHIPLVLAGPDVPQGVRRDEPVQHLDLGRTLLDLAGLAATSFPGRNLLEPPRAGRASPRYSLEAYGRSVSVEHEGWLAVLHLQGRDSAWHVEPRQAHQLELFHLPDDGKTAHDLVDAQPERARAMRRQLIDWLGQAREGWADGEAGSADVESLEQLGYVAPADDDAGGRWQTDDCAWCQRFG